jgi:hypothetical protein
MILIATQILLSDIDAKLKRSRSLVAESQERIERTEILMDMEPVRYQFQFLSAYPLAQLNPSKLTVWSLRR